MTPAPPISDDHIRSAFVHSSIGIALVGTDGRFLQVNPALCELLGYAAAELVQLTFQDITHPDDLVADLNQVRRLLSGAIGHYRMEKRYFRRDGQVVTVLLSVSLVHGPDGAPLHFISQVQDFSEMKRAQETIRSAEQRFRAIFNNTFQLIGLLRPDGTLLEANETALRLGGFSQEDAVGRALWDVPWWTGDLEAQARIRAAVARAAAGEFVRYETTLRDADGELRTLDFSLKPVFDDTGVVVMLIPEGRDISDRVALEAQLRQAQKMEAVGRLAGGIAHDFNNLLSVITTEASLMFSDASLTDSLRAGAEEIVASAQRGAELTRQLLALGRRQLLQPRFVEMDALVSGITTMLRRLLGEDVLLSLDAAANPGRIRVDPGQLEQAILNLAINARDAMPAGGEIRIETGSVLGHEGSDGQFHGVPGQPYVVVRVRDTGSGIPSDALPQIFDPFFTTKEPGKGTGLGLSMVYGFVSQSSGFIEVDTEVGRGTSVSLLFPEREVAAGDSVLALAGDVPAPHGTETILLVEDEEPVRRATRRLLERHGYTVLEAGSAEAALEIWERSADGIALLLTDWIMPGMHGPALAARLRAERPALRTALISGYTGEHGDRRFELASDMLFIQKPFLAGSFLNLIRRELDQRPGN